MPIRRLDKTFTGTSGTIGADELTSTALASVEHVKPHIQPGTLQPAVAGKLLDGTTSHSGAYGTAQSDGRSYYYTDIKGSLPIKDPRIGTHFGGQRHKFKSLQLLEQETASHGDKVYSIDGREWCRAVGNKWSVHFGPYGNGLEQTAASGATDSQYIEIVGYFNDANVLHYMAWAGSHDMHRISVNGGTVQSTDLSMPVGTPIGARFLDAHSLINLTFNSTPTLGINTLKIANTNGHYLVLGGVELIVQDTTSTATRSKIQIHSQNVVSYGKKLSVSAAAHHYDPFNGFTNGTSLHSAFVDTATSLGLDHAPGSSAKWAISSTNNIRPYNGGRVVKWIASDGTIKTSVNMMPPNAQNIKTQASNEITTPSATNTTTTPNFSDDAIDQTLAESAKRFDYREFGNGSANQGTGGANYADFSMNYASSNDDNVYVMDDGLTTLWGEDVRDYSNKDILPYASGDFLQLIFIGTGISLKNNIASVIEYTPAQNLPYGTHILKLGRTSNGSGYPTMIIDGITMTDVAVGTYGSFGEVTFHQPKMPPIPEDACIISDYMLMADFVKQTNPSGDNTDNCNLISKGVRANSMTRDLHYHSAHGGFVFGMDTGNQTGWYICDNATGSGAENNKYSLPAFGTNFIASGHSANTRNDMFVDDTDVANSGTTGNGHADIVYLDAAVTLGVHKFALHGKANQDYAPYISGKGYMIATPTHTSSHYQEFETPFLKELVGGDRNMEQTNLVVTPDGKTWDEVTRDTSYMGNQCLSVKTSSTQNPSGISVVAIPNRFRGLYTGVNCYNKDIAIGYDRYIFLKDGHYTIHFHSLRSNVGGAEQTRLKLNGTTMLSHYSNVTNYRGAGHIFASQYFKRGDYFQIWGVFWDGQHALLNVIRD